MPKLTKDDKNSIIRATIIVGFSFYILNIVSQRIMDGNVNDMRSFVWSVIIALSFGTVMYIIIRLGKDKGKK